MPNYFSDHYTTTVGGGAPDENPRVILPSGVDHATLRYKRATVTVPAAIANDEILRFFPMKSGDRLIELFIQTPSLTGTSFDAACGLYLSNNGAVLDIDLFCAAATAPLDDLTDVILRTDIFALAILDSEDRAKPLWENLAEGAGSDTSDPFLIYDVCITMDTEDTVTVGAEIVMEAVYTAGGN